MQDNNAGNMSSSNTQMNTSSSPQNNNTYNSSTIPGFVSGGIINPGAMQSTSASNSGGGMSSTSSIPLPQFGPYGNKLSDGGSAVSQSASTGWSVGEGGGGGQGGSTSAASGDMLTKAYTGFQQFLSK